MAEWLLLVYRIPSEPSAPRVAIWRALKKLKGTYLRDGVFIVPASEYHDVTLRSLAHDIRNYGGEAHLLAIEGADDPDAIHRQINETSTARSRPAPRTRPNKGR